MSVSAPSKETVLARSIGYVVDRTKTESNYLGNAWLIDDNKVATCAHLIAPYANYLEALSVTFPGSGKEYGVDSTMFHPQFDQARAMQLLSVSLTEPTPQIPLQKYNAVVLNLTEKLTELTDTINFKVAEKLSLPKPPREQGLGGNLREIDLFVVIQSIAQARKEGIITICDARNYPVARLFCQSGRILYAQFRNLINEMAIYQIINRELDGNFFFWAASNPNWEVSTAIAKPADMVLIEAHRRADELKTLVPLIGRPDSLFERKIPQPNLGILPTDVQDYCRRLWQFFDGGTPVGQLWQVSNLDDYAVYVTLSELKRTQQIAMVSKDPITPKEGHTIEPLSMAVNTPLNPEDKITNIHIDIETGRALAREGQLLGTVRNQDKYHLLHNVTLVPEATGSPLFKENLVIGMHCGPMPPSYTNRGPNNELQGMLWVDSIVECLRGGGANQIAERLTLHDLPKGEKPQKRPPGGCKVVAKLDCPKCGRTSMESSRFCKSCGQALLKDAEYTPAKSNRTPIYVICACFLVIGILATILMVNNLPQPHVLQPDTIVIPDKPWSRIVIYKKSKRKSSDGDVTQYWKAQPRYKTYKEKDLIHLKIEVLEKSYVYLMLGGSDQPSLIYPVSPVDNKELDSSWSFTYPNVVTEYVGDNKQHLVGLELQNSPGKETFLLIASPKKLNLIGNTAAVEQAYKRALQDIKGANSDTGILEPLPKFCKGLIANDNQNNGKDGQKSSAQGSIFIDRFLIKHTK